ncbi:unnamed protein product [Clavelina lepadiformis]|uniref:Elongation of very long chain fatty acids protein n=1 Tax=Clavelina lepadiformis TaxID=159417 RepID=A0ABP0GV77_CLALP
MLFTEWIQEVYTSYLTAIYEMADPRTAEWLLVKSPLYPSLILLCYVYFCVNSRTLTARMPAYKLRPVLILYNLFMVILSSYMVVEFFLTAYLLNYTLTCQSMEYDSSALPMRPISSGEPTRSSTWSCTPTMDLVQLDHICSSIYGGRSILQYCNW